MNDASSGSIRMFLAGMGRKDGEEFLRDCPMNDRQVEFAVEFYIRGLTYAEMAYSHNCSIPAVSYNMKIVRSKVEGAIGRWKPKVEKAT